MHLFYDKYTPVINNSFNHLIPYELDTGPNLLHLKILFRLLQHQPKNLKSQNLILKVVEIFFNKLGSIRRCVFRDG